MHEHSAGGDQSEHVSERLVDQVGELAGEERDAEELSRRKALITEIREEDHGDGDDEKVLGGVHKRRLLASCKELCPISHPRLKSWGLPVAVT